MCLLLHIETATEVCSVCLAKDGKPIAWKENTEGRMHAALLPVFIHELLEENGIASADLDAIAVSKGPGSYTGLRIGVSTAKGLSYGSDKPLIAIPTLKSMCIGIVDKFSQLNLNDEKILLIPMIDARRMEVYTAVYDTDLRNIRDTLALVVEPGSFDDLLQNHQLVFFGNGSEKIAGLIRHPNARFIPDFKTSAIHMTCLAYSQFINHEFVDVAYFEPYYLKDFITTTPKNKVI